MFTIKLMGFHELETRSFFTIGVLLRNESDFPLANDYAQLCATELESATWILCNAYDCDGITVDVFNEHGDVAVSYELVPGRPMTAYHGDECHE